MRKSTLQKLSDAVNDTKNVVFLLILPTSCKYKNNRALEQPSSKYEYIAKQTLVCTNHGFIIEKTLIIFIFFWSFFQPLHGNNVSVSLML